MQHGLRILTVIATVALSACQSGTIFKSFKLTDDTFITTGARQRVITNHNPNLLSRPGTVTPGRIVCTEPSPDVAAVVASSFGVGLSIPGTGAGSASGSKSEALAQLAERTGSIQLMRERMYRACEAYSNGAITGTTYTLLMARFDWAMATVLFGEIAGGAFGRSPAAIGSKSSAEASASILSAGDAIANIEDGAEALAAAGSITAKPSADIAAQMQKMHADLLDANPLDDYIAACMVELERSLINSNEAINRYVERMMIGLAGSNLSPDTARSMAAVASFVRQSGLFEHCRNNLASTLEARQREISSLQGYELELKRQEHIIREA